MKTRILSALVLCALAPLAAPQGSLLVVDQANGPGTDHTTIGAAVSAAASGDAILVRAGSYFEGIGVGGLTPSKSLVISADTGASVRVSQIYIDGLSAEHTLTIRGIDVEPLAQNPFAIIQDCAGDVWLEEVEGLDGFGGDGVDVRNSDSVVVTRCRFGEAFSFLGTMTIQDSHVALFGTTLLPGINALYGLEAIASEVLISGGRIEGKDGFDAIPGSPCTPATPGQPAVRLRGSGAELTMVGEDLLGGQGGQGDGGSCGNAPNGPPVEVLQGNVIHQPGAGGSLEVASPVRVGEVATVVFRGRPGDLAYFFFADRPQPGAASPFYSGWSVLKPPHGSLFLGIIPPSGVLTVAKAIGPIGGLDFAHAYKQGFTLRPIQMFVPPAAVVTRPFGRYTATAPTTLFMLDESF